MPEGGEGLENDYRNHRVATIETGKKRNIGIMPSHDVSGRTGSFTKGTEGFFSPYFHLRTTKIVLPDSKG